MRAIGAAVAALAGSTGAGITGCASGPYRVSHVVRDDVITIERVDRVRNG